MFALKQRKRELGCKIGGLFMISAMRVTTGLKGLDDILKAREKGRLHNIRSA